MRNAISLLKHYLPPRALSRTLPHQFSQCRWAVAALVPLVLAGLARAAPAPLRLPGRPAPDLAAILLPRHAPSGSYQIARLDAPIETAGRQLLASLGEGAQANQPAGAWTVTRREPLEAFGNAGLYDRSRLARLFDGRPARVLRAPIVRGGRVVASLTLLSPYPDAGLTRLEPGTLAILFMVDAAREGASR